MKLIFTALFVFIFLSCLQAQQPGTLNKSYGNNNTGTVSVYNQMYIKATAVQADDKLILGGCDSIIGSTYHFALTRHNKDGSLDTSFANEGRVITALEDLVTDIRYSSGWNSIAVQTDGKIVAVGNIGWDNPNYPEGYPAAFDLDIVVARFLSDGTPDESFGNNGRVVTNLDYLEYINSVAVQPDGKIVVSGYQNTDIFGNGNGILLVRYNYDGSLDTGFGDFRGYTLYDQERGTYGYALLLQPDGKMIVGGTQIGDGAFLLARYLPNGKTDQSFGSIGSVKTSFGSGTFSSISSLALDDKERICATGTVNYNKKVIVTRYLQDGTLDKSFDKDGKVELNYGSTNYKYVLSNKILAQPENKLAISSLIAGSVDTAYTLVLSGLNEDGTEDTSFGKGEGKTVTDIEFDNSSSIVDAVMQSDGKIIVSGSKTQVQNAGTVPSYFYHSTRFYGYPQKVLLYVKIKRWLRNHTISWQGLPAGNDITYYSVEQSANGKSGFVQIAKVSGINHLKDYSITNNRLLEGNNYYRVKAVSARGVVCYSEMVYANHGTSEASVYPNPATNIILIKGLPASEKANMSITDAGGNLKMKGVSNGEEYRFQVANLLAGTYYIHITTGSKAETLTFVKE